jgi:uncharacterized protein (TIGR02680 family)
MASTIAPPQALPEPERPRWTALRAGIQNVWEYDDRRFLFSRGRLLLRGQNEAGKTKALELLFPFLLDADLAPQRLDPFGTNARPMRWNLVNDLDPEAQMRVGYVWLELGRREGERVEYVTLGAGLKARRSSTDVDAWFFLTSQRPDRDIALVQEGRPLAKGALEEAIGAAGQVFERRADHRRAVNAKLFGLQDEQYGALVDTLLHLRRPQLSKTLDPEQLSGFLTDALPPLDAAVIGPIAEGFESLDHHRAELENLVETLRKLQDFSKVYRSYAVSVARERADALTRAESAFQRARAGARERAAERDARAERVGALEREIAELGAREGEVSARIRALEESDAYRAARDLDDAEERARHAERRASEVARRAADDAAELRDAETIERRCEEDVAARAESARTAAGAAKAAAEAAVLSGPHGAVAAAAAERDSARAESALAAVRAERDAALSRLRALHAELASAENALRVADERARERDSERDVARDALAAAERAASEAWNTWADEVEQWRSGLAELPASSASELEESDPSAEPAALRARVEEVAAPLRQALADEAARSRATRREFQTRRDSVEAERDALARARHPLPPAPAWRRERPADRPGAPLYELCDFGPAAEGAESGLEAALEASGLLDAWVEPDGTLLDPLTGDAILRGAPVPGRTLADVLVPVAAGGISLERARAALSRVGLVEPGAESDGPCWISADGRFRLGALAGAHMKDAPAYVGASARERERARRLAELEETLRGLDERIAACTAELTTLERRAARLASEVATLPPGTAVAERRAESAARAIVLEDARKRATEAEARAARAADELSQAAGRLDRTAAELGLAVFARDPARLAELSTAYYAGAAALLAAVRELARAEAERERAAASADRARTRAGVSAEESQRATAEASEAAARAAALREASGAERDEVLAKLRGAREERDGIREREELAERERSEALPRLGSARTAAEVAEGEATAADAARKTAADAYRWLATAGLLAAAGFAPSDPPESWSYTAALEHARGLAAAAEGEARGTADLAERRQGFEDKLMRRHTELATQLPPGVRLIPSRSAEVLSYQLTWNGHTRPVGDVIAEIDADVAARNALLGQEESQLIERFLTGEAHDHLAARLRAASALVDRMNAALEPRTTSAGAQVRLCWTLDASSASDDAHEAVPLFFKGGALLTEANRRTLRTFLERRLAQAREADDERPLQERLAAVLDYRRWHRFEVQHREPGQAWSKLTRKAHGAGSGGKKSVMLHLPLFAAVAAFYDAASSSAPRLIGLDEAFAGIDRPTRASLMGLLAEFDLDFVMTSFEEWGCYPQLDGLAIYHLTRELGVRGVFAEQFLWNGRERVLVDAS